MTNATDQARLPRLRESVRAFLADWQRGPNAFVPSHDSWLAAHSPEFSRALGERGWIGMTWPTSVGGLEAKPLERLAVIEELLVAGAPVAAHWFAERQIGPGLLKNGTPEQIDFFLPRIAAGTCYFSVGMSEPNSGSDLASVATRAVREGSGWRVNGAKLWTSGAHLSHYLMTLCRTDTAADRHAGLSQIIVPLDAPGVTIYPIRTLDGSADFNEVVLDGVLVDEGYLVGQVGEGWQQVTSELAFERSGPERYLSWFGLLREYGRSVDAPAVQDPKFGALIARMWAVRALALSEASGANSEASRQLAAALVKDVGTTYERQMLEEARRQLRSAEMQVPSPDDPEAAPFSAYPGSCTDSNGILNSAILHSPGITLRGGTTEVLRSVIWQGLASRQSGDG
jgi:alkylation response protein AidB-like acyl-CoA dehydrogenase